VYHSTLGPHPLRAPLPLCTLQREREFFIDNLLVQIHL